MLQPLFREILVLKSVDHGSDGGEERDDMDLLLILGGAALATFGFILSGGTLGTTVGCIGLAVFLYGLIVNHRGHQGLRTAKQSAAPPRAPLPSVPDPNAALAALLKMKNDGLITDDEFSTKKAEILKRL